MHCFGTIYADATALKCWPGIKTIATNMTLSSTTVKLTLEDSGAFWIPKEASSVLCKWEQLRLICRPISKRAQLSFGGELHSFTEPREAHDEPLRRTYPI